MFDQLASFHVRHVVDGFEPLEDVPIAQLVVGHDHRSMAVKASPGRLGLLAAGESLVFEHVSVTALLPVIEGKGIASPHFFKTVVLLQLGTRHHGAGVGLRRRMRQGFTAPVARSLLVHRAQIKVVLHGKIFPPDRRVVDGVIQLHHAVKGIPGFLLVFEDVDQKRGNGYGRQGCKCDGGDKKPAISRSIRTVRHQVSPKGTCDHSLRTQPPSVPHQSGSGCRK